MKRQITKILMASLIISAIFVSCKKDMEITKKNQSNESGSKTMSAQALNFQFYTLGQDILEEDFLLNPDDPDDEAYNYVEYALTLSLLEAYNNHPYLIDDLVTKINSTQNKCYNLFTFADEQPQMGDILNDVFAARFSDFGGDWKVYVENNYVYDTSYVPFARFINTGGVSEEEQPYIAAPFEIDEEKFEGFDNNIPFWIKDENGTHFATLTEQQAGMLTNPIVLISNGHDGDDWKIMEPIFEEPTNLQPVICEILTHTHEYLSHQAFKINERYEGFGASEYVVAWGAKVAYRPDQFNWVNYGYLGTNSRTVNKSDIGDLINWYFVMFSPDMFPSPHCFEIAGLVNAPALYNSYAVGAYEKDWWAGWKDVFTISNYQGVAESYAGRRKYDSEWYFFNSSTNNSYRFDLRNPTPHSTYYNYNKGELQLHRWN